MKKLSVFILLIAATYISCNSDDDSPGAITEDNLIGKWQLTAANENETPQTLDECDIQDVYEFKTGGDFVNTFFNSIVTIANGQTTITCEDPITEEFSWSLSGDQLTFSYDDTSTETLTIILLNNTTLTTKYTEEESGTVYVYTETYTKL